jgi:hypothetical protein
MKFGQLGQLALDFVQPRSHAVEQAFIRLGGCHAARGARQEP